MTILNTLLFGMVASLVALKMALLAAATILLVHVLAQRNYVVYQLKRCRKPMQQINSHIAKWAKKKPATVTQLKVTK